MFSPEYAELQRQFHQQRPDYGVSGFKYADNILALAKSMQTRDILDYGCGKTTLAKAIPFPIQNYDPFIAEFAQRPQPADIVVCTDVMEHIELEYVGKVLDDIQHLTKKLAFFQIATRPAVKLLPDGRNAHIVVENANWWLAQLIMNFSAMQFQNLNGGFIFLGEPLAQPQKKYCGAATVMGHGDNAVCGKPYINGVYQCANCKLVELQS